MNKKIDMLMDKLSAAKDGWLGVPAPRDMKERLKVFHKYIKRDELADDGIDRDPHITVAYGLDNIGEADRIKVIQMPKGAKIKVKGISTFDNPDKTVLKFDIDSDDLKEIHNSIEKEIGLPGKTFKDYKPHMTIAYLKKGSDINKYKPLERLLKGKEFTVDNIRLRIGNENMEM